MVKTTMSSIWAGRLNEIEKRIGDTPIGETDSISRLQSQKDTIELTLAMFQGEEFRS